MWLFVLEESVAPIIYKLNYILMLNQKKMDNKKSMLGGDKSCGVWIKLCGVSRSRWIVAMYVTTQTKMGILAHA